MKAEIVIMHFLLEKVDCSKLHWFTIMEDTALTPEEWLHLYFGDSAHVIYGELEAGAKYLYADGPELEGLFTEIVKVDDENKYIALTKVDPE